MGFKRYLLWNDAIYGSTNIWININYSISQNCFMVTNTPVWTVIYIGLIYPCDSGKRQISTKKLGASFS